MDQQDLFPSFDIDIPSLIRLVKEKGYSSVLLQLPEGMKRGALSLADLIEKETGAKVLVDGELCYGACDHAGARARLLGIDAVVHLGHSDIPSMKSEFSVPVHFFHAPMRIPDGMMEKGLKKVLEKDTSKSFGLAAPIQHVDQLETLKEMLEESGRNARIGPPSPRERFTGQVLGCSFGSPRSISEDVKAFIYLGTGRFHPLGMVSAVKKRVWALDPISGDVTEYGREDLDRFLRKRFAAINSAGDLIRKGKRVGIVVGTKPGQMRMGLADDSLEACKRKGVNCYLVAMDQIDPMKLRSLQIRVAVITACPRIAYDDICRYREENITMITANELMIALGMEEWEGHSFYENWDGSS